MPEPHDAASVDHSVAAQLAEVQLPRLPAPTVAEGVGVDPNGTAVTRR